MVELLAKCALGDQRAFAQLYQRTAAKLFSVSLRILRRKDWAEEVLQESFVAVWTHAGEYKAFASAPMTWMTSIVRNRALDRLRKPNPESSDDYEFAIENWADENPGPMESLLNSSEAKLLANCLQQLTGQQRQTITLAFYHGLTHPELAAHMQQPLGTVKTWIRRGLDKLRNCLEH